MKKHGMLLLGMVMLAAALVLSGWTNTYDKTTPAATGESPSQGDDRIREVKLAVQERLHIDMFMPFNGNVIDNADAGKHMQITFTDQDGSAVADGGSDDTHTPAGNEGILDIADVTTRELFWYDENGGSKQLTEYDTANAVACLHLEKKDFILADSAIVDDDTIEVDATNGLQLKAGGDGTGIQKTHLASGAGQLADGDTITIDGTNGLQANHLVDAAFDGGTYAGSGSYTTAKTVDHGLGRVPQYIIVTLEPIIGVNGGAAVWTVGGGSSLITDVDADSFAISGQFNVTSRTYSWAAF